MNKWTRGRWLVAALTACAVLTSGCAYSVDPGELPGVYRNDATGDKIVLDPDGTFSATDVSTGYSDGSTDFSGRWEFRDSETAGDFVYLSIEDDGLGEIAGIQLYTTGQGEVEFRPDPDGQPLPALTKAAAP